MPIVELELSASHEFVIAGRNVSRIVLGGNISDSPLHLLIQVVDELKKLEGHCRTAGRASPDVVHRGGVVNMDGDLAELKKSLLHQAFSGDL